MPSFLGSEKIPDTICPGQKKTKPVEKRLKYRKWTTPTCSVDRKKQGKRRMIEDLPIKGANTHL